MTGIVLTLVQKTTPSAIDVSTEYDIDTSPPYSPTPSESERPCLPPQMLVDLRTACAIIVNETNPPDPDEEPDHRELLRRFEEERRAKEKSQPRVAEVKPRRVDEHQESKKERKDRKSKDAAQLRASEKEQKAYARQVEMEARRQSGRDVDPGRRMAAARQVELTMGRASVPKDVMVKTGFRKEQPKSEQKKERPSRYSVRRPKEDMSASGPRQEARQEHQTYIPKQMPNFDALTGKRRPSEPYGSTMEPLEPTHTKISSKAAGKQREVPPEDSISNKSPLEPSPISPVEVRSATPLEFLPPVHATIVQNSRPKGPQRERSQDPALRQIRDDMHARPKTSAAACVDYAAPSGSSSKSTSRSNTEYDNHYRPTSTAMTSAIITPGEDKRSAYSRRPSNSSFKDSYQESYQGSFLSLDREETMSPQARAWQQHKLNLYAAEQKYKKSGWAARPGSRASKRSLRRGNDSTDGSRPLSRAGSIAESITSSINSYIRPRASQDSMRSGWSSSSNLSRSDSHSSSMSRRSGNGWWRNSGLRRKGSWSSFRSARPDREEPTKSKKNGEPNLNRPLPALPGLDQYKEAKTHIGQLMKSGGRGRKKNKDKHPKDDPDAAYIAGQHQSQGQHQRQTSGGTHIQKASISAPILRNESMERTLHRYRESQIQQEPPRNHSQIRQQQQQQQFSYTPVPAPDYAAQIRKESNASSVPTINSTSRSRTDPPIAAGKRPSRSRLRSDSSASKSSKKDNAAKLQKAPPPLVRGPSYQKEVEAAVYPRPMDVNKGPAVVVEVGREQEGGLGTGMVEVGDPSVTVIEGGEREGKRKLRRREKVPGWEEVPGWGGGGGGWFGRKKRGRSAVAQVKF